jgi:hypothetical protein
MVSENPTWGVPRIHGELLKLGFEVSERSVSRWMRRAPRDPDSVKRSLTLLRNHGEAIAAMDFFTVSTLTFDVLYCFFVIGRDRRKILHFNVTRNPNALWVVQQLREAWVYQQPHRFLLFDRDAKFGAEVVSAVRDVIIEQVGRHQPFEMPLEYHRNSLCARKEDSILCETRWPAPSLCGGSVDS